MEIAKLHYLGSNLVHVSLHIIISRNTHIQLYSSILLIKQNTHQVKIEVFQLVKHNFLFNGEGFYAEEEDGEEEEEEEGDMGDLEDEEEAGILNSEQEWL